jgi:hypothetical protein
LSFIGVKYGSHSEMEMVRGRNKNELIEEKR